MEKNEDVYFKDHKNKIIRGSKIYIAYLYHSHVMEALNQKGKTRMKRRMGRTFLWLKNPKSMATSGQHNMPLLFLGRNYYTGITKEHNKW